MTETKKRALEDSWIYFLLIILFCFNLFGRGSIVCLVFSLFALLKMRDKLVIDGTGVAVLIFTAAAFISAFANYGIVAAIQCLNFGFMYVIGLNGYYNSDDKSKYLQRFFFALFAGFFSIVLFIIIWNFDNEVVLGQRLAVNPWSGEYINVTLVGLLCSVLIGYFFYATFINKNLFLRIISIVSIVAVIAVNVQTSTRTPIVLLAIIMAIMVFLYLKDSKNKRAARIVLAISIVGGVLFFAYYLDILGLQSAVESTPIYQRFEEEGMDTRRTEVFVDHLRYMIKYPLGGEHIRETVEMDAHNLLQQCYDLYGAPAFLVLAVIFVDFIKNLILLFKLKERKSFDYLFISMYIIFLIQVCLEPVFTGYPCFFFSLLMFHGTANAYLKKEKGLGAGK